MIGFPISNTNSYYGKNVIEGQNAEFILGETKISLSSGENKLTLDL